MHETLEEVDRKKRKPPARKSLLKIQRCKSNANPKKTKFGPMCCVDAISMHAFSSHGIAIRSSRGRGSNVHEHGVNLHVTARVSEGVGLRVALWNLQAGPATRIHPSSPTEL